MPASISQSGSINTTRVSLHICAEVDDIVGAVAELKANGVKLIDDIPRVARASARVIFLD